MPVIPPDSDPTLFRVCLGVGSSLALEIRLSDSHNQVNYVLTISLSLCLSIYIHTFCWFCISGWLIYYESVMLFLCFSCTMSCLLNPFLFSPPLHPSLPLSQTLETKLVSLLKRRLLLSSHASYQSTMHLPWLGIHQSCNFVRVSLVLLSCLPQFIVGTIDTWSMSVFRTGPAML